MKRRTATLLTFVGGVAFTLIACLDWTGAPGVDPDAGATEGGALDGASGMDVLTDRGSSTNSDASDADAANLEFECPPGAGGISTLCRVGQVCCNDTVEPTSYTCTATTNDCLGDVKLACAAKSDCGDGGDCCYTGMGGLVSKGTSKCTPSCTSKRLCRTTADCDDASTCSFDPAQSNSAPTKICLSSTNACL